MPFYSNTHISSVDEVQSFFHHLACDRKLNFHPDDDFADYVLASDASIHVFTPVEADEYNRLMDEAFNVCKNSGADIYELGLKELQSQLIISA